MSERDLFGQEFSTQRITTGLGHKPLVDVRLLSKNREDIHFGFVHYFHIQSVREQPILDVR